MHLPIYLVFPVTLMSLYRGQHAFVGESLSDSKCELYARHAMIVQVCDLSLFISPTSCRFLIATLFVLLNAMALFLVHLYIIHSSFCS